MGVVGRTSPLNGSGSNTPERRAARTPDALTPDDKRSSYFGRTSPGHSRSPSYAWQPGTVAGRQSPGPSLTPEEFVQQRYAAANRLSGYTPHRSISAGNVDQMTKEPKKLQKKRDSRPPSRTSTLLEFSSNLSAREQEHVARMTGGPLVNMDPRARTPDPSVGLIGAIEAREQEKRNIRDGVSGQMVQAAIAQRHQHAQAQQMHTLQAAERAYMQQHGVYGQQAYPQQPQYTSWGAVIPPQAPPSQQWMNQQSQSQPRPRPPSYQQQYDNSAAQQQQQQRYGGYY